MLHNKEPELVKGNVNHTILKKTIPIFFGILSIILFNVVDSYFIGMLGYQELSAISYTFPVTFAIMSLTIGIGVGTSSLVSKSIGESDLFEARKIVTHSLCIGIIVVLLISIIGYNSIDWLFSMIGAKPTQLVHIHSYMSIWYLSVGFVVLPIIGNASIRATGDAKTPSLIMSSSALLNFILDPIFIFGWEIIPPLGIKGAAFATAISYSLTFFGSLFILYKKKNLIDFSHLNLESFKLSSVKILSRALPVSLTNMLIPLTNGYLTKLASQIGPESVAAFGVCSRLESLSLVGIIAISMILNPFVGQNLGAGQIQRIQSGVQSSYILAIMWSSLSIIIFLIFAESIAQSFSSNATVQAEIIGFCWVVPFSYFFLGISELCSSGLNGLGKPKTASFINFNRLIILTIPIASVFFLTWGLMGIFLGKFIANIASGILGTVLIRGQIQKHFIHQ